MGTVLRCGAMLFISTLGACGGDRSSSPAEIDEPITTLPSRAAIERADAVLALGVAASPVQELVRTAGSATPRFERASAAEIELPILANGRFSLTDGASGTRVRFGHAGVRGAELSFARGLAVYSRAGFRGSDLVVRVDETGIEDHVWLETRPDVELARYELDVSGVAGLRFVGGALEFLDASGAPRLRVSAPFALGHDGERHPVRMTLHDCRADRDPRPPWGRVVTAPGASSCRLELAWGQSIGDDHLTYPALVDPKWTLTNTMAVTRCDHTATELADGRVLVAGGYDAFPIADAELFDRATNTFAVTAPLSVERALAKSVRLVDGKALITGGYKALPSGGTEDHASSELYDPGAGTWTTSAMSAAHSGHAVVKLDDGRVVVASGHTNGSGSAKTTAVEVYDPATGLWSQVGDLSVGRAQLTGTLLSDGRVLIAGGGASPTTFADTETIDPSDWDAASGGHPPVDSGADAGTHHPASPEASEEGGCGCRTVSDEPSSLRSVVFGLALLSMLQRRRARRRVPLVGTVPTG